MGRLAPTALAIAIAASSCGGPLDRRDGALRLLLRGTPDRITDVAIRVDTAAGSFAARIPAPEDGVITSFSAIPIGTATVNVELLEDDETIDAREGMKAVIREGATTDLVVGFGPETELIIDLPQRHHPGDGPIAMFIRLDDESRDLQLTVEANDRAVDVTTTATGWFAELDPAWAGEALPHPIEVLARACPSDGGPDCTEWSGQILVDRRSWSTQLQGSAIGRPTYAPSADAIMVADDSGRFYVWSADIRKSRPELLQPATLLPAPVRRPVALLGTTVIIAPEDGSLTAVSIGADPIWQVRPPTGPTTPPSAGGDRIVVGAERELLHIDPETGEQRLLARTPAPMRAKPWLDAQGIVVVDVAGNVLALAPDDSVAFQTSVDSFVEAPPLRVGDETIVATLAGHVHYLDDSGRAKRPADDLGAPVVHAPIRSGDATVVAAGDQVVFLTDGGLTRVTTERAITGGPAAWVDDRSVVVGLQNGAIVVVDPDGRRRRVSRIEGAARSPRVLPDPPRIVVAGSRRDLDLLRVEPEL